MNHSVYFGNGTNEPSMCTSEAVVRPNIKDKVRLDLKHFQLKIMVIKPTSGGEE